MWVHEVITTACLNWTTSDWNRNTTTYPRKITDNGWRAPKMIVWKRRRNGFINNGPFLEVFLVSMLNFRDVYSISFFKGFCFFCSVFSSNTNGGSVGKSSKLKNCYELWWFVIFSAIGQTWFTNTRIYCSRIEWVFPKIVVSQNGWFIMENPIRKLWFGGKPLFSETSKWGYFKQSIGKTLLKLCF